MTAAQNNRMRVHGPKVHCAANLQHLPQPASLCLFKVQAHSQQLAMLPVCAWHQSVGQRLGNQRITYMHTTHCPLPGSPCITARQGSEPAHYSATGLDTAVPVACAGHACPLCAGGMRVPPKPKHCIGASQVAACNVVSRHTIADRALGTMFSRPAR